MHGSFVQCNPHQSTFHFRISVQKTVLAPISICYINKRILTCSEFVRLFYHTPHLKTHTHSVFELSSYPQCWQQHLQDNNHKKTQKKFIAFKYRQAISYSEAPSSNSIKYMIINPICADPFGDFCIVTTRLIYIYCEHDNS